MNPIDEIKRLYYDATPGSIERDLKRAVALLIAMPSDDERERVAVYMDGLAQMKAEWHSTRGRGPAQPNKKRAGKAGATPGGAPRRPPRSGR